jgi:triosephosphate isomerase (TIM)
MEHSRRFLVGGNWKSNNTHAESEKLVNDVLNKIEFDSARVEVVVAPVFVHIPWVQAHLQKSIQVSAQNCSLTGYGAYTGEITGEHLKDLGLPWVILGHSERRQFFGEDDKVVADKVQRAVGLGLNVMACIGERLPEREAGQTMDVLRTQLEALKGIFCSIVITLLNYS